MPRNITVTFDDGSSHVYQNAPDNITPEQVNARAQQDFGKPVTHLDGGRSSENPSLDEGMSHSLVEGIPILGGLYDKGIAAAHAARSYLHPLSAPQDMGFNQSGDASFSQNYNSALASQQARNNAFHEAHPVLDVGSQIAGGMASGIAAAPIATPARLSQIPGALGAISRMGLMGAENSVLGGADAFTRGQNVAHGALVGGAMGAGSGAVSGIGGSDLLSRILRHGAGVGIGAAGGAGGAALDGGDALAGAALGAVSGAAGEAASEVAKPVSNAAHTLDPNAGDNVTDRVFNAKETAARKVAEALAREGTTTDALSSKLAPLGRSGRLMDASPILAQMASAIGTEPGRGQSLLRNVTDTRDASSGNRISDILAKTIGPKGDGDALISSLDQERREAAGPLYEASLSTPVTDSDELRGIMETDAFKSAVPTAEKIARNEGRTLYSQNEDGSERELNPDNMTLQDLHYVQRAMQDHITEARPGLGIKDNELSRSISGVRQNLLGVMDEMSPEYKQARDIYSGSSRVRDAYADGFGAFDNSTGANHLTNEMMERNLSGYESQAERQAYLLGARQRLSNVMGSAKNSRQKSYSLFGIGNDNPDFENSQKLATLLSYVRPAETQEAALGVIQDDLRSRLGYSIASPEDEITPENVHSAENPLLNEDGELVEPDSDAGRDIIRQRMSDAQQARDAAAEELSRQKQAALQFSGPNKALGQQLADALISSLKAERQFSETKDEVSGNSKTARRLEGRQLIASPDISIPASIPSAASKAISAVANGVAGNVLRRRADAVNYEIAKIISSQNTNFAPPPAAAAPRPGAPNAPVVRDPVRETMIRNPQFAAKNTQRNLIAQALISAAITQANIQGDR
ncbi:MAG: hypothetical protein ABF968_04775 [Acetobacter sp.]|uniref:hypothetical protein n=1 Tax=Acetobacter sp. TaxID=440 RepID=UPI0039EBD8CA